MKKRIWGLLLATLLLLTLPATAGAAWDGSVSSGFANGSGSEAAPYQIKTEAQLAYFAALVNNELAGNSYFSLQADLDMTGGSWSVTKPFYGSFLGNGYTITLNTSFLSSLDSAAQVSFLNLQAGGTMSAPLLCNSNSGNLAGCRISGSWSYRSQLGGLLCNTNSGSVQDCSGVVSLSATNPGTTYLGFIAQNNASGMVENCYVAYGTYSVPGSGRYSASYTHPIAGSNSGALSHCYSNINGSYVTVQTLTQMQSQEFTDKLNLYSTQSGYQWTQDPASGYPLLSACLNAATHLSDSDAQTYLYHSKFLQTQLACSLAGCSIYYTLDGSNPISSPTRQLYSSTLTLSGDFLLRSVAWKDGEYSAPYTQQCICLPGSGTAVSPYLIQSKLGLNAVRQDVEATYRLDCDLTFTPEDGEWTPIGSNSAPFTGVFDGNSKTISGLQGQHGGLFHINSGLVENLLVTEHTLYNADAGVWGAIADYNYGSIYRCYAASAFTADSLPVSSSGQLYVGGMAGYSTGNIEYCRNGGLVGATCTYRYNWQYLGGITGYGSASSCVNEGPLRALTTVTTEYVHAGGISGCGTVTNCRNNGSITVNASMDYDVIMSCAGAWRSLSSSLCYDGATSYTNQSTSGKTYSNPPANSYNKKMLAEGAERLESTFANFDFTSTWMITEAGPVPQGVMDENGNCYIKVSYVVPTCQQAGSTLLYSAGTNSTLPQTLAALPHTPVTDSGYAATCHSTGLTDGQHCAVCNHILTPQETVPQLPHTWQPATCTAPQTCSVCAATQGDPLPVTVDNGVIEYQAFAKEEDIPQAGAMLYAARYENGRITAIDCVLINELNGHLSLTDGSGSEYKLFLLTPEGLTPLSKSRALHSED